MNEDQTFTTGVDALIERMKTHPEEFFGNGGRWGFMYKEHFRDVMTESEKGRLHEALKVIRRMEFDVLVLKELMKNETPEQEETEEDWASAGFGSSPVKREGSTVMYDTKNRHRFTATDAEMAKQFGISMPEYAKKKKELGL